jgi:hypothetical protein
MNHIERFGEGTLLKNAITICMKPKGGKELKREIKQGMKK